MARGTTEADAEVWRDRVRRWKESGLTAKVFAEREGISRPNALSWWQHHLKQKVKAAPDEMVPALKLVRLEPRRRRLSVGASAPSPIEIHVGAARVVVSAGCDDEMLRRVLTALGADK